MMRRIFKFARLLFEAVPRVFFRFVPSASLVALFLFLYSQIPFYDRFLSYLAGNIILFGGFGYIFFGFFYHLLISVNHPGILRERTASDYFWNWLLVLPKRLVEASLHILRNLSLKNSPSFFDSFEMRTVVLGIFVKAFFFPLMLQFLITNVKRIIVATQTFPGMSAIFPTTNWGYMFWISLLLVIDTGIFMFAYIIEHVRLGNKVKSVDPTISGWFVALVCYPPFSAPFNKQLDQLAVASIGGLGFVLSPSSIFAFTPFIFAMRTLSFLLFVIYVWATVALGWRAGNLTNRGIVVRGPYCFVRHPAYAAKNLGWWFELLPRMNSFVPALVLLSWNIIYIFRAVTEERHLLSDSSYRDYCKRVRWRFIPRVI